MEATWRASWGLRLLFHINEQGFFLIVSQQILLDPVFSSETPVCFRDPEATSFLCLIQQLLPQLWSVESAGKAFAFVTSELQLCNTGLTPKNTRQFLCCTLQQTWSARLAPTLLWKQRSWPQAWRAEEKPNITLWRYTQVLCPTGFQMWHKN